MFFSSASGRLVYSASDLVTASACEYATLVTLDDKLGRRPAPAVERDEMLERAAALGDEHEHRVLASLVDEYGRWEPGGTGGVLELPSPGDTSPTVLDARRRETLDALGSGADVVFQGTFWDGSFVGYADFLVKNDDGRYAVWDTKLARHAKATALLQIAAYGDQLVAAGLTPADEAVLVLGDGEHSVHPLGPLMSVLRERRARFLALVEEHLRRDAPVEWDQPGVSACGRCDYCRLEAEARDDLLLVARMSLPLRKKLRAAGVETVANLAQLGDHAFGGDRLPGPVERLREQARMQSGADQGDGHAPGDETLRYRVLEQHTIGRLPAPDTGDLFFDFEGDPMFQDGTDGSWGLEYLFGVIEDDGAAPVFRPFWAHSRSEERRAFLDFVAYVEDRRRRFPGLRIYHYAAYEKTALRNLAARHGTCEDTIDEWLRTGLLVDLLETVHGSLRISADSYSIKRLEPFYMGDEHRVGDVTNAGASVVAYAHYTAARDAGDRDGAAGVLESIRAYNEYDCVSTLRLRDWLLTLADRAPSAEGAADVPESTAAPGEPDAEPTAEELRLADYLAQLPRDAVLDPRQQAVAMVAAATGFHRRERKQYWWGHFDRLETDPMTWQDTRDVVVVNSARVLEDWEKPPRKRTFARRLSLRGAAAEGSDLRPGSTWFAMYAAPAPAELADPGQPYDAGARGGAFGLRVDEVLRHADGSVTLTCTEKTKSGREPHGALPMALTPDQPIRTASIEEALAEVARDVGAALPALPGTAALDILTRTPPRLAGGAPLPEAAPTVRGHDYISAVTAAVLSLRDSYLAVQGPPGTGKTYLGSHVIAALVERGWKIGVVSQGHVTVDGMLAKAIDAGVDPGRVAKKPKDPAALVPWEHTDPKRITALLAEPGGCLIGGTAWTMTGSSVPRGGLDLLVIDEAGQFSLANTLAVGQAAKNLLLLGDPQQLPQVTQGTHPVPVDTSALGWLSAGHPTLPPEFGYFLADSWRMHPALCAAVSRLSYDGQLASAPAGSERHLDGVAPGVETVLVDHEANTVSSAEEADVVVDQIRRHLGLLWQDRPDEPARHLATEDILVVAAYNAQVAMLRERLAAADLPGVRVGTVDKFQGQEAPVVIVSMACSSAADAPRGMEFLLNRNRLNVAVSRGMWRAVIVRSPELTGFMPTTPEAMVELGAFLQLSPTAAVVLEQNA
ncbi:TM0106 family RecB-like putative nuclease [Zhihengliuella halotolerans]|uniref:AAA+ ATPase domain-containing protein n=1 Tax=Zhihengliuella halotolerans TaxID=370736 RepID=A0A4Q8AAH8_9MICC|nr:bifunctional RecB family nuclease/DEAD/DEAH box helicase [Zhihengliuella halotolerans]RZU60661.1 uncharacterized protein EV380_0205 [Zhihengliuella halotolerans]